VFGMGHPWELAIIVVLALIVFGPKRLPEIGGALGKGIKEFKKGTQELHDQALGDSSAVKSQTVSPPRPVEPTIAPPTEPVAAQPPPADREAS
jgi:sec-independent protein translocase protein TatA